MRTSVSARIFAVHHHGVQALLASEMFVVLAFERGRGDLGENVFHAQGDFDKLFAPLNDVILDVLAIGFSRPADRG